MNKIKTLRSSIEHLTENMETTLCGKKIYSSWIDTYDSQDKTLCKICKEIETNGKENKDHVEPSGTSRRKKWRMATWEN